MTISTFTGSVTIRERIAIPPGAVATIKLVSNEGEVLAASAVEVAGVPVDFSLAVDDEILKTAGKTLWWALLRTQVGAWGTLDLVPTSNEGDALVLTRIPD